MAIEISLKKGTVNPTSASGLTLAEPVFNVTNNTLWIGKGSTASPIWVGAGVCGASGGIAAGLTYQIPTLGAVKDYFTAVSSNFLGTTASYVTSFNGLTGALQGVSSWNGSTGAVTFTNYVVSFNGNTGAVSGASLGANTFTGLNTFSAGISAAGATFGATVTIAGGTAWHSLNDGAGSGLDADLVRGVAGQRFVENLQTGILYGGIISVNAGNSAWIDISAGVGIIASPGASLSAMPVPTVSTVTWTAKTGVTLSGITGYDETWISFNSSGVVTLRNTAWTNAQYASEIPIGAVYHVNRSSVNLVKNYPHVAYAQADQMDPFVRAFGPLKLSGHEISANGANLSVNRTSGTAYAIGRNYQTDPNNPNVVTDSGATPASVVYRFYKNGGTGYTTVINSVIDPDFYDDGTGTLHATGSTKWQIQRIFYLPNQTNTIGVYYGTIQYTNLNDAQFGLLTETFAESESTATQGIFLGYLLVKGSCTDLSDTAKAKFVQAGLFRSVSGGGGSGLVTTSIDDLSDVVITSAANDNLLRYSGGQWINSAISTLPLVASFNGLTGAVQGVSAAVAGTGISVSGTTGSVTITNIGVQSFNGRTGAVQGVSAAVAGTGISVSGATGSVTITNTGVQSFNGLTGAVTGVTVGGVNVFTALNSFSAGLSAAGGVTFSGNFYGTTGAFSKLLTANGGVFTDSVVPLAGLAGGGTLFINSNASGGGGAAITYIGDWASDNNGTNIVINDNIGEISIAGGAGIHLYGALDTNSTATIASTLTVQGGGAVLEWDGSLPAPTVLTVSNTLTTANTLTLSGQGVFSTLNTNGTLQYGAAGAYSDAFSVTTATTGVTTMGSWTKTAYRSFEFDVQGSRGTTGPYQFTKILAVHDGTTVTSTQLSNISTVGVTVGTYTVDISGSLVRLRVTPGATASTVFKAVVKAIPA